MKNLLYGILFHALVGMFFVGCKNSDDKTNTTKKLEVTTSDKQSAIKSINNLDAFRDMQFVSEKEFETDYYHLLMLNFESESSKASALVVLYLNDNYVTLLDNQSLRFVKASSEISGNIDRVDGISPYEINGKSVYICNESCCQWSQLSVDHFRCDCPSAVTDIEFSTGSGCSIKVVIGGK
ncbi:hypothetical protein N8962_02100 [Flavobacteriales bacterium]|nr:hypothetical protein [Flavobacteriales bacterium]